MHLRPDTDRLRTTLGAVIALAAGYFVLAELGLRWATANGAASPVFPAAGLALAGLVLGGIRLWPAVFIGRMAASLIGEAALPLWADLAIATGNTLSAVVGAKALQWSRFDPALRRLQDVLTLIVATLGSTFLAALVGTAVLLAALGQGSSQVWLTWLSWWAGDLTGVLIVTPLVLSWALGEPVSRSPRQWLHLILCTALAGLATWAIFGPLDLPLLRTFPLFPLLIWAALAGGVRGITTAMVLVSIIAIWGTTSGYGPLAAEVMEPAALRFVLLQEFIGLTTMTGLALAVVADERRGKEALQRRTEELGLLSQELHETRNRLAATLAAAEIGTWAFDVPGDRVVGDANLARMFSVPPETAAAGAPLELFMRAIHPADLPGVQKEIQESLASKDRLDAEYRLMQSDGSVRWVLARGHVHRDSSGQAIRIPGVLVDITERKLLEEQRERLLESERHARTEAERASRLKDEFLATVSHELRTPLHAILGWSQILGHGKAESETLQKAMAAIERNGRSQAKLIDDLLDMSRIITGKIRLDVLPVDLHDVISAAIETVRPAAEAKEIRIQKILDPKAGPVRGDPNRLQQAIWNLLSNAVKFTPKRGKIQVSLERIDSHVEVTVVDTGQGIEPEFLPYVFDRFRQADSSTSRRHGGLGLGLAIVKHLVELHGGRVHARSSGRDQGATFIVELPLSIAHPANESSPVHPADLKGPNLEICETLRLDGVTVLAVDDEPDALAILRHLLEECHARVLTAGSATEALDLLQRERPDILLSDVGMPVVDGYELIRRIRTLGHDKGGDVPAVALTAFARSVDRTQAMLAGYQTHLTKPVQATELIAVVASLTGKVPSPHEGPNQ